MNKNRIIKAVQEGIKLGFKLSPNSIVDDSSYINFNDSKVDKVESLTIEKMLEQDFVDLGLSVKWAKCNIGATCRYNDSNSWYGNCYTWGEINPINPNQISNSDSYDLSLCKKYNKDALHILLPKDDIVTLTYHGIEKFRMPTKEEMEELLDKSKIMNEWKKDYQGINGLCGREFTSLINGNSIFIPAAGYFDYDKRDFICFYGLLWSNSLDIPLDSDYSGAAFTLYFDSNHIGIDSSDRYFGPAVRGICE